MQILVWLFYGYFLIGILFGIWFVTKGVHKVDEGMVGVKKRLRLMLLPGAAALWPILLKKYLNA